MDEIKEISFPNTVADIDRSFYSTDKGYKIERILKNGEMARIEWFKISKPEDGLTGYKTVAEIKESVCDIYYN